MAEPDPGVPSDREDGYQGVWRTALAVLVMVALGALLWWLSNVVR